MELIGHSQKKQYLHYGNSRRKIESVFKAIMADNFPNLGREMDIQTHETQKFPNRATPRHITIKLSKVKNKEF